MARMDEVWARKMEESKQKHIQGYFDRAESAKQIPGKMLEYAIMIRFSNQIQDRIEKIAERYEETAGEDFSDLVKEVYEEALDDFMKEYDMEYRDVICEALPEGP